MWRKRILSVSFIVIVIIYFFLLWRVAHNYSQSYAFGDENAHLAGGSLILKGLIPYRDFSINHQPLVYFFPAAVQKIFHPNTLFQFIGRQRESVYVYSIIWNIIYLLTFGPFLFLFTATFEIMRYVMLGNKVLGEPLAVYPLICIFGLSIKRVIFNKQLSIKEIILFSLSTFLATFSLLPIWPSIFILNVLMLFFNRKNKKWLIYQIAFILIPVIILFIYIPFRDYFQQTFIDNYRYVIPHMNTDKVVFPWDYLKMVFLPFTGFHARPDFIEIMAIGFIPLYLIVFYLARKMKKTFSFLVIVFTLLLVNNRTPALKFGNFHVLPWIGVYFFIPIVFLSFYRIRKFLYFPLILLIALIFWLNFFSRTDYYGNILTNTGNNLESEHYINYSDSVKYGMGIKAISSPGDRLQGLPNDTLVFWVSGVMPATTPLEAYDWQYDIPRYGDQLHRIFTKNPPEFFLETEQNPLKLTIKLHYFVLKNLDEKYVRINHTGHPSSLYILKSKLPKITDTQWTQFKYLLFEKPNF